MSERTRSVLGGRTFVVGDGLGDVRADEGEGAAAAERLLEAATIAPALLAAAPYFEHRLPEVFAGFPRALTSVPVAFPTDSRPQAWASGTPLLVLTTLLKLSPTGTHVRADLPSPCGQATVSRQPDCRAASHERAKV